ncbi:MAG: hypothetical protein WA943_03575 [Parvibaculum sp.]|uniref:hypothetical protein n=1 Tax=Parvibaculum sp. TaxID=2024848 RepID=UPI003C735C28
MLLSAFWKHLTKRRRRVSFYETQHQMRRAIERPGPTDILLMSDEALKKIVEKEPRTLRGEAAHHELETRLRERRLAVLPASRVISP